MVRIWRFHRHGPGSIPGMGTFFVDSSGNFGNYSKLSLIASMPEKNILKAYFLRTVQIVQIKRNFYFFLSLTTLTIFILIKWIYWKRNINICESEKFWFEFVEFLSWNLEFIYTMMENNWTYSRRWWFSGRILACHARDRGSIPWQRTSLLFFYWIFNLCSRFLLEYSKECQFSFGAFTAIVRVQFLAWEHCLLIHHIISATTPNLV